MKRRGGLKRAGEPAWQDDRGAATILVLALGLVFVAAGIGGAAVCSAQVGRHTARNAADLGALAGATRAVYGTTEACARAARFVTANGARMTSCTVDGLEIVVRAEVMVEPLPGLERHAEATSRAGPVSAPAD